MFKQSKLLLLFGILAAFALVLAACPAPAGTPVPMDTGSEAAAPEAAAPEAAMDEEVVLDVNFATEPPSLDPSLGTDTTSVRIMNGLFLALTELDPATQAATPMLATSWDVSADGTVWTFNMRGDVPWVEYRDGQISEAVDESGAVRYVTAGDVAYGLIRTCNAATASDYAYVLYVVQGCEEANTGDPADAGFQALLDGIGVNVIDDTTIEFTLKVGAGYFGQIASMWIMRPMPQWAIDANPDTWTEPENMVSNGPFALAEWIHNDILELVRNPMWYGWTENENAGNIERIRGLMIEEASTSFALYENNELDTDGVPLEQMDRVMAADGEFAGEYNNTPSNCTYYYGFITQKEAVSDARVRQALSMGVDRKTLSDRILKGGQIPANTFTNPLNYGSPAGDTDIAPWALPEEMGGTGYAAAVEMGLALLAEAGYPNGDGLSITLAHNVSEGHAKIAQAIQAMWTAAYPGIQVIIETQEWGVYLNSLDKDAPLEGKPDVYRLGWCADYPHANNWIHEVFNPTQGSNDPMLNMDDPQVGAAVTAFNDATITAQTADPATQLTLYKEAERLLIDEIAGIIPIYYYTSPRVTKPWLTRIYADQQYEYRWTIDMAAKMAAR